VEGVDDRLLDYFLQRGPHWRTFAGQVRRVGGCEQPIRLTGRKDLLDTTTGEVTEVWSSAGLPDGTVLVACGNRRATRCQPCSRLYQGDAYHLIVAGLRGGKTTPATVATHPALFATLTAPSFGPVHSRALDRHGNPRPCQPPTAADGVCGHGRRSGCPVRHQPGDPLLGQPICADCFDYEAAVLFNAHVSELWRRTRIDIYRQLAKLLHRTERAVKAEVRVEYVKVAEYQRRGLLHYHAAIRLDSAADRADTPPGEYTVDLLAAAIRAAVAHVQAPYPKGLVSAAAKSSDAPGTLLAEPTQGTLPLGVSAPANGGVPCGRIAGTRAAPDQRGRQDRHDHSQHDDSDQHHIHTSTSRRQRTGPARDASPSQAPRRRLPTLDLTDRPALRAARWGAQLHLDPITPDTPAPQAPAEVVAPLSRRQVAGYLAKYATKHTETLGGLDRRIRPSDLHHLTVNPHVWRLVATTLLLASRIPVLAGLTRWAHQLGYGGHWLTKSRRWSTTFTALRQARADWQAERAPDPAHTQQGGEGEGVEVVATWTYVASGYRLPADHHQAEQLRDELDTARHQHREQRWEETSDRVAA